MKNSQIHIISSLFVLFSFVVEAQPPTVIPSMGKHIRIFETETNYPPPPPPEFPDFPEQIARRIIFFVHGLAGEPGSWAKARSATQSGAGPNHPDFKARDAWTFLSTYIENASLRDAGIDLYTYMGGIAGNPMYNPLEPMNNFIIAHSQGGLVARSADIQMEADVARGEDRFFNGIVTFGTPHQGAMILNHSDVNNPNNKVQMFAEEACEELGAGPLVDLAENNIFIDLFTNRETIEKLLQTTCSIVSGAIPIAFQDFLAAEITKDYLVGSDALSNLNDFSSDIHKVAFYGVEDDPLIWRTMSSFRGPDQPNSFDYFEADQDMTLYNETVIPEIASYQANFDKWNSRVQQLEGPPYFMPCDWLRWFTRLPVCLRYNNEYWEAVEIRNAYGRGLKWFDNADSNYKDVIGALTTTISSQWYCKCEEPGGITKYPVNDPGDCDPKLNCWPFNEYTVNVTEEPSDGVVLGNSARDFPGAIHIIKMLGSNHQQMRNDSNTKAGLLTLYDGGYDDYFYTKER